MAKVKKYYAVKAGFITGILESWEECKKSVVGYSGAVYKGFLSEDEALEYLNEVDVTKEKVLANKETLYAYVDGSFSVEYCNYSYGVVLLVEGDEPVKFNGVGDNPDMVDMRNVSGEITASMKAIEWAYNNGYNSVLIHHDYEGVEAWATGRWKANKAGTKAYVEFIRKYEGKMDIAFEKVKAHSGDIYNEMADEMASLAFPNIEPQYDVELPKIGIEKDFDVVETLDDSIGRLFEKIVSEETAETNAISYSYNGYKITEKKLEKFVKELLKVYKFTASEIASTVIDFSIDRMVLNIGVRLLDDSSYMYVLDVEDCL